MKEKIHNAEKATRAIQDQADKAARTLSEGCDGRIMINFYGIFTDPRSRAIDLRIAREEIDKALALIDSTKWPTNADYEAAERESSGSRDDESDTFEG
jgi:hypothetical protein